MEGGCDRGEERCIEGRWEGGNSWVERSCDKVGEHGGGRGDRGQ